MKSTGRLHPSFSHSYADKHRGREAGKMNINKKFDRMKQWGKERMGGEKLSDTTEEFKSLEQEMTLRQNGMTVGVHKTDDAIC